MRYCHISALVFGTVVKIPFRCSRYGTRDQLELHINMLTTSVLSHGGGHRSMDRLTTPISKSWILVLVWLLKGQCPRRNTIIPADAMVRM